MTLGLSATTNFRPPGTGESTKENSRNISHNELTSNSLQQIADYDVSTFYLGHTTQKIKTGGVAKSQVSTGIALHAVNLGWFPRTLCGPLISALPPPPQ